MSALPLLIEFSEMGIKVRVEGTDLALTAPKGALTSSFVSRIKEEKMALLVSLDRIRDKAGYDWLEVANDPAQLKTFVDMLAIEDMRHRGVVPNHYTAATECQRCGPVPVWEGCPPEVKGCPWCFNRHAGLPIPKVNGNG
jgi:hypothetical protein